MFSLLSLFFVGYLALYFCSITVKSVHPKKGYIQRYNAGYFRRLFGSNVDGNTSCLPRRLPQRPQLSAPGSQGNRSGKQFRVRFADQVQFQTNFELSFCPFLLSDPINSTNTFALGETQQSSIALIEQRITQIAHLLAFVDSYSLSHPNTPISKKKIGHIFFS